MVELQPQHNIMSRNINVPGDGVDTNVTASEKIIIKSYGWEIEELQVYKFLMGEIGTPSWGVKTGIQYEVAVETFLKKKGIQFHRDVPVGTSSIDFLIELPNGTEEFLEIKLEERENSEWQKKKHLELSRSSKIPYYRMVGVRQLVEHLTAIVKSAPH
ncbi:MAG: hypothetical protein QXU18_11795 [Thermoplasmatales archaeon]